MNNKNINDKKVKQCLADCLQIALIILLLPLPLNIYLPHWFWVLPGLVNGKPDRNRDFKSICVLKAYLLLTLQNYVAATMLKDKASPLDGKRHMALSSLLPQPNSQHYFPIYRRNNPRLISPQMAVELHNQPQTQKQ